MLPCALHDVHHDGVERRKNTYTKYNIITIIKKNLPRRRSGGAMYCGKIISRRTMKKKEVDEERHINYHHYTHTTEREQQGKVSTTHILPTTTLYQEGN